MKSNTFTEVLAKPYFRTKRMFLHLTDILIRDRTKRNSFCSWATFPRFAETINHEPYAPRINVAFCFNQNLILQATTTILSLLHNSPTCSYDIYCVTDITPGQRQTLSQTIAQVSPQSKVHFLKPNSDYADAQLGTWSDAIYWRCMLPALLPNIDQIIYADVDTVFLSDLRAVNEIDFGDKLIAGCFDKPGYINSGFMVMNLKQIRTENIYPKMIDWARNNLTKYPDQDMINHVCHGRILPLSRKYNLIVVAAYSMLKNMTIKQYNDLKHPVMLHYAGKLKPWDYSIKSFFTFDIWRKYARMTGLTDK
ncbi:MAG: glycosyltransferase family 8 protein [Alphaproteobacteria bacterium]|nr:glycosyltransferase family 8 protein [Alphaproteobacteria bacterium]